MSQELLISLGKIAGSVALLVVVLFAVAGLSRHSKLAPEIGRKLIHVSLGVYCLTFPFFFRESWEVAATCALAIGVFALARGRLRATLGEGLHAVNRSSYGEVLFAISVALLFQLYVTTPPTASHGLGVLLYVLPLLILTLCDAAAAVIGSLYGKRTFQIEDGIKSWEGVAVFTVTAWLFSLIAILLFTDIGRGEAVLLAFVAASFGALLEAASWRGLDNLFIPIGLYVVLSNLLAGGMAALIALSITFAMVLGALLTFADRLKIDRHWLATAATLFFCIAIFSGILSLVTPLAALAAYAFAVRVLRPERPPHDSLTLLLVVLAVAMAFFIVSNVMRIDTIFGFNLAFAGLAVGILARAGAHWWMLIAACVAAWALMGIRTIIYEGLTPPAAAFSVLAAITLVAVALLGRVLIRDVTDRPWIALGGLSVAAGMAGLAVAPL